MNQNLRVNKTDFPYERLRTRTRFETVVVAVVVAVAIVVAAVAVVVIVAAVVVVVVVVPVVVEVVVVIIVVCNTHTHTTYIIWTSLQSQVAHINSIKVCFAMYKRYIFNTEILQFINTMSLSRDWSELQIEAHVHSSNGKDNRVRLRTSSRTIGEDGSKPNPNRNPKPNTKPDPKKRN